MVNPNLKSYPPSDQYSQSNGAPNELPIHEVSGLDYLPIMNSGAIDKGTSAMEIRIDITSEEMTDREVDALSRDIGEALYRARKADRIDPVVASAPNSTKGIVSVIGSLLVGLPTEAITGALDLIKSIASRPGQPVFVIRITRDTTEVSFDPRRITPDEVAKLAKQLRPRD